RPSLAQGGVAAVEEIETRVVEVVAVVVVERTLQRASAHVEVPLLVVEKSRHRSSTGVLIAVVLSDDALSGLGIVRLADLREQEQPDVVERERRKNDDVGGLDVGRSRLPVDVPNALDALVFRIVEDLSNLRVGPKVEVPRGFSDGNRRDEGARLRAPFA